MNVAAQAGLGPVFSLGKRILVAIAIAALAYLGVKFYSVEAMQYFNVNESSYGPYWAKWGWLLTHLSGGSLALFMGPLQFWTGLRLRHMRLHRWTGRLYVLGVAIAALSSLSLAFTSLVGPNFGVGLFVSALVWLAATGVALLAALKREYVAHKHWMIRSYVITFAFVLFRWLEELPILMHLPFSERLTALGWISWVVPLFAAEIILQLRSFGKRTFV